MSTYRLEKCNIDDRGSRPRRVYDMPAKPHQQLDGKWYGGYWDSETDVPCPRCGCQGTIRWAEAGYVPGYRDLRRVRPPFPSKRRRAEAYTYSDLRS
jgi:hypothetical protein